MTKGFVAAAFVVAVAANQAATAQTNPYYYSMQDVLIGADRVQSQGSTGAGVNFGVIDTGVLAPWVGFTGRVAPIPPSACLITPSCTQSLAVTDDNGHGSFVASEIIGAIPAAGFLGVAPGGNVVAVKVLNAQGSGSYSDVASGIKYAAGQPGVRVLNLSLGPFTQNTDVINAVNYAASQNAVVVFAGGNSSAQFNNGRNIAGLTDAAIQSLIFMGSTNQNKQLSSFSNKPGNGGFVSTTGKFYPYATRWLVADGENIWGASTYYTAQYGYSYITQMSGTSMAAPQAAGSAGLLLGRWSYLTSSQVAALLLMNGQDLGAKGADKIYGEGFLNVYNAFTNPIGPLQAPVAGGALVSVQNARVSTSGPLGNMARLSSALSQAVAFDSFGRDFPINLAGTVVPRSTVGFSAGSAASLQANAATVRRFTELADGGYVAMGFTGAQGAPDRLGEGWKSPSLIQDPTSQLKDQWSFGMSQGGTYVGAGQGGGAALSFGEARWGGKSAFWGNDAEAAGSLLALASNASYATGGFALGKETRVSFSVTNAVDDSLAGIGGASYSRGAALGYTFEPTHSAAWKMSVTTSFLGEKNMLLGAPASGALALGDTRSIALGLGNNFDLGGGFQLGLDAVYGSTNASRTADSLIAGTTRLSSLAFGMAVSKESVLGEHDLGGVSLKKPLRVYGGSALVDIASGADGAGNPVVARQRVSLVPNGSETALGINYSLPLADFLSAGLAVTARTDADNVAGAKDLGAMLRFRLEM